MMVKWIKITDEVPEESKTLFYFFGMVGVHIGEYCGIEAEYCPDTGHVFGGKSGWLTGDVTHWMYLPEGFDANNHSAYPDEPEGYTFDLEIEGEIAEGEMDDAQSLWGSTK
jgi:hypothetical protein